MKSDGEFILQAVNLSKSFSGNLVLSNVNLSLKPGEYHALIGENGAGKSTFINLITGIYLPDGGEIIIDGQSYSHINPVLAKKLGIYTVHQELSLNPQLTVSENIFLGSELTRGPFRDQKKMRKITQELLESVGLGHISPDIDAGMLSMAEQQMIEFCKAIYQKPRILILDEATSALDNEQVSVMFRKLRELRETGMAMIFISHRLHELYEICDEMTVLKDGCHVATETLNVLDEDHLVTLMTGRTIANLFPPKRPESEIQSSEKLLEAKHVSYGKSKDICMDVRCGEILGIGGLQGQGQQELLECLFGMKKIRSGELLMNGSKLKLRSASDAMRAGIAYLPAERKTQGLFIGHNIRFNLSFANLRALCNRIGTIKPKAEAKQNNKAVDELSIKTTSLNQLVSELSGGNQQKVVLAKWLARDPKLLLLNEPTRGIDVGTKKEIYELLYKLAQFGTAIVMISSDTIELLSMCDRVITIYENQINGELLASQMSEEALVKASVIQREAG